MYAANRVMSLCRLDEVPQRTISFFPVFDKYHTEYEFDKIVIIIIVKLRTFPRKQYQNGIAT